MIRTGLNPVLRIVPAAVLLALLWPVTHALARQTQTRPDRGGVLFDDEDDASSNKKKEKKAGNNAGKDKAAKSDKTTELVRWGQRRNEPDEKYDKRYASVLKRVQQDKKDDTNGGTFVDETGQPIRLWTYMGHPFIVRSDIDAKFTADAAMYMEMLHREYSQAYQMLLGEPADVKEKIEVIIFANRATYMKNGGSPGSGGFFNPAAHTANDRGATWPAKHFRLVQFTDGVTDFARWPKGTLKHESAHMELQLRLGYTLAGGQFGMPVDAPRWFNEGQATCFEYWNFDKTVEENFADIPNRGRYAPVIRRIHDTDKWKEFSYVWKIDGATWLADMTSEQGFLNYAQSWSLAAYMMNGGKAGRRDFRTVFDLSKRVGADRTPPKQTSGKGGKGGGKPGKSSGKSGGKSTNKPSQPAAGGGEGGGSKAWDQAFPAKDQEILEKNWNQWVATNLPKNKTIPDEKWLLMQQGFKPEVTDKLESYTQEEIDQLREKIAKGELKRRQETKVEK